MRDLAAATTNTGTPEENLGIALTLLNHDDGA
jgi:hypothetical protein